MSDHGAFPPHEPPILAPDPIWPVAWVNELPGLALQAFTRAETADLETRVVLELVWAHADELYRALKKLEGRRV